jgi:prevent-host-death family protein
MSTGRENTLGAAAFKARCLALLDRVASTGESLVITKRGKPVARVTPFREEPRSSLKGSVRTNGDVVGPILDSWDVER